MQGPGRDLFPLHSLLLLLICQLLLAYARAGAAGRAYGAGGGKLGRPGQC